MMADKTNQRKSTRFLILIIAALIVGWTVYQEFRPNSEVGTMEYRLVTGNQDGEIEIIMIETSKHITVLNSSLKEIFENNDAEIISRPEQLELLQQYRNLQYRVSLNKDVKNENIQLRLSREDFNKILFDSKIVFRTDRKVQDSIIYLDQL